MRASAYPLHALLELRRRQREAAEVELRHLAQLEREALERVRASEARLSGLEREDGGRPPSGSLARDWHLYSDVVKQAQEDRSRMLARQARASAELAEGRANYARTCTREESLIRHQERFLQAARVRETRREDMAADDRAATRARAQAEERR